MAETLTNLPDKSVNHRIAQGSPYSFSVDYTDDAGAVIPITTVRLTIRKGPGQTALVDLTEADAQITLDGPNGHVDVVLDPTTTNIPCGCWPYSLVADDDPLLLGDFEIVADAVE